MSVRQPRFCSMVTHARMDTSQTVSAVWVLSAVKQRHRVSNAHTEEVCHQNLLCQWVACTNSDDGLECLRSGEALWEALALPPLLFFLEDVEQCHDILEAAAACQRGSLIVRWVALPIELDISVCHRDEKNLELFWSC
jgi:hypothetical protein